MEGAALLSPSPSPSLSLSLSLPLPLPLHRFLYRSDSLFHLLLSFSISSHSSSSTSVFDTMYTMYEMCYSYSSDCGISSFVRAHFSLSLKDTGALESHQKAGRVDTG